MFHLLYASSATQIFTLPELKSLLETSRENNARRDISGMLLYKGGNFMQVLEGDEPVVRALYDKIALDPRHGNIFTLLRGETVERQFPGWSMAFRNLDDPEVIATPGYSEFLNFSLTGNEFSADPIRCQRLLMTFKKHLR